MITVLQLTSVCSATSSSASISVRPLLGRLLPPLPITGGVSSEGSAWLVRGHHSVLSSTRVISVSAQVQILTPPPLRLVEAKGDQFQTETRVDLVSSGVLLKIVALTGLVIADSV